MEVKLLSKSGIPDDAVLSIRKGNVRRQAQLDAGRFPFRFPTGLMEDNPLRIDILVQVGSGFLVMKPGDQRYKVTTGDSSMVELELSETDGKSAKAAGEQRRESQDPIVAKASAKGAKEYLEHHGIFSFVQAVLQAVIEDQPTDPYRFMARLFLDGGYRDFTATSESTGQKPTNDSTETAQPKEEAPAPACDEPPPAPPPAEGKTELQEASTAKVDPPPASVLADEGTGDVPDSSLKSLPAIQSPADLEITPEPIVPGAAPPAEAEPPQLAFEHLPSVGAWLTPLRARPWQAPPETPQAPDVAKTAEPDAVADPALKASNAAPTETPEMPAKDRQEAPEQEVPEPTENVTEAAVVEAPQEEPSPEQRQAEVAEDTARKEETEPLAVEASATDGLANDPAPLPSEPKGAEEVQSESKDVRIVPEPAPSATEEGVAPGAQKAELDQAVQAVAQSLQKTTAEVPAPEEDLRPPPLPSEQAAEDTSPAKPKQMPDAPAPARRELAFEHLPSVGAWLTPLLASHWQDTSPAESKQTPSAPASVRREPVFEHLPSVGAWLTPLLAGPWQMRLAASDLEAPAEAPQESFFPPAWPAAATERRPPPPEAKEMDLNVLSTHPAGPKYSMAPLIGKRSGSDEVGPGKYAEVKAEEDKYSKPPCWSIGNPAKDGLWGADGKDTDKLDRPEADESGVPGPGQYFPVDQSPYSPKFGFGSRRKDPKLATCPGPGQYELKSTLQGNSGPSWGKPPPDSGRGKGKDGKSTEPGPGEFSPNSSITSRSAPAIGFSASNRDKASVNDSPGPGQYDLATTLTGGAVIIRSPTSASIKEEDNTIAGPGPPTSSFRSFSSR